MPLSQQEKTQLQTEAQTLLDAVNALTIDPAVDPLQPQLDAANATITALQNEIALLKTDIQTLKQAHASEDAAITKLAGDAV